VLALAALFAGTVVPSLARAQDALDVDSPSPAPPAAAGIEQAVVARYWELGSPRLFFASTIEAGYAYAKPKLAVGYGLPYWRWIGLEVWPLVSTGNVGGYAGIGGAVPGLSFRTGARYTYPFSRTYLDPRDSYTRLDLDRVEGDKAAYLALEAELTATVPAPAGSLFGVLTGYRVMLVPDDQYVFEDSLRTVMEPPYIWRARLGYLFAFGRDAAIRIGPAADYIGVPNRGERVVRAGLVGSVAVTAHVEAQASFIPVIVSPDTIGLAGGDFGQLGIRYRWATDSRPAPDKLREAYRKRPAKPRK
jgi:hypothetical protein